MNTYEVTGYIYIPTTVTVQADTVEDALDIGRDQINDGLGHEHDQYMSDNYYVATEDGQPVAQFIDNELILEGQM
jgi:hypothetical protein